MDEQPFEYSWVEILDYEQQCPIYLNLNSGDTSEARPQGEKVLGLNQGYWLEILCPRTQRMYYHNSITQDTTWERPSNGLIVPLARVQLIHQQSNNSSGRIYNPAVNRAQRPLPPPLTNQNNSNSNSGNNNKTSGIQQQSSSSLHHIKTPLSSSSSLSSNVVSNSTVPTSAPRKKPHSSKSSAMKFGNVAPASSGGGGGGIGGGNPTAVQRRPSLNNKDNNNSTAAPTCSSPPLYEVDDNNCISPYLTCQLNDKDPMATTTTTTEDNPSHHSSTSNVDKISSSTTAAGGGGGGGPPTNTLPPTLFDLVPPLQVMCIANDTNNSQSYANMESIILNSQESPMNIPSASLDSGLPADNVNSCDSGGGVGGGDSGGSSGLGPLYVNAPIINSNATSTHSGTSSTNGGTTTVTPNAKHRSFPRTNPVHRRGANSAAAAVSAVGTVSPNTTLSATTSMGGETTSPGQSGFNISHAATSAGGGGSVGYLARASSSSSHSQNPHQHPYHHHHHPSHSSGHGGGGGGGDSQHSGGGTLSSGGSGASSSGCGGPPPPISYPMTSYPLSNAQQQPPPPGAMSPFMFYGMTGADGRPLSLCVADAAGRSLPPPGNAAAAYGASMYQHHPHHPGLSPMLMTGMGPPPPGYMSPSYPSYAINTATWSTTAMPYGGGGAGAGHLVAAAAAVSPQIQSLSGLPTRPGWDPSLFRKGCDVAKLLTWQKESIHKALLESSDKSIKKEVVHVFKLVQMYMGDRKSKYPPGELLQGIVQRGKASHTLRDEIFMQLCKQTTSNPDEMSTIRGWELICACVQFFPPSEYFRPYVIGYMERHLLAGTINEEQPTSAAVLKLAHVALSRLQRGILYGTMTAWMRQTPLSVAEVQSAVNSIHNPRMFGSSLEEVMNLQSERFPERQLPWILTTLVAEIFLKQGHKTEGIFRVCGDPQQVNKLRERCERWHSQLMCPDPHTPATLLKQWLIELAEPLFPAHVTPYIMQLANHSLTMRRRATASILGSGGGGGSVGSGGGIGGGTNIGGGVVVGGGCNTTDSDSSGSAGRIAASLSPTVLMDEWDDQVVDQALTLVQVDPSYEAAAATNQGGLGGGGVGLFHKFHSNSSSNSPVPYINRLCLAYLVWFLQIITDEENQVNNRMSTYSLSMLLAPNLFPPVEKQSVAQQAYELQTEFLQLLVENWDVSDIASAFS